ncbi:hypothetical protein AVCANL279_05870 [Campylobacter canadensis]|uniref:hypothetical protein n=1 Tax=Campylobacter canadensis TaxID=449520 RepID=UPI0015556A37|nr:hypothetical protein [Campylobacter canadensis]MBZ7994596.1 hypothetical protein [Campylobacter canadensis]MBZ7996844.1 hypothetical protein [Campylobacter canadensis]MBZ7999927.1 hypothetical protein [Campylobacter canadensis]MBZ8001745.1 hypothetical protein [Campylobacter canadensis]MBZ8004488.1 hypothetical protein [Campylobacter canadensis]
MLNKIKIALTSQDDDELMQAINELDSDYAKSLNADELVEFQALIAECKKVITSKKAQGIKQQQKLKELANYAKL